MSIEMSSQECRQYVINNKPWGSYSGSEYSTSGYSNISSSPMECSSKLEETSSLCSSSSGTVLDMGKLPKPPPSLGRRKQRQVTAQTLEVFEFSDSFPEPIISFKGNAQNMSSEQPSTENGYSNYLNETKDRYDALRNVVINDNDTVFVEKSQTTIQQTNNPFASAFLEPCYNGYMDSAKSDKKPFKKDMPQNDKAVYMQSTEKGIVQNEDKYAAISDAIQVSNEIGEGDGSMKWSRSVMGYGQLGWSDEVLHGESC